MALCFFVEGWWCAGANCEAADWQGGQRSQAEPKAVPEYAIGGVVVESVTGKPVGHALVVLVIYGDARTNNGNGDYPMRRVMTDGEGKFEIQGLTETGRGGMQASKPGYRPATAVRTGMGRSIGSFQELDVEPGASPILKLIPEATIAGKVVDASGEPIEGLPIHLTFEAAQDGRRVLEEQRPGVNTNEEGEFRFADLQSGRYFVSAGPSGEVSSQKGARGRTPLGYATIFYGGGSDPASASPIDVTAGKHADIDLRMELQPLLKVTGGIGGAPASGHRQVTIYNTANQRVLSTVLNNSEQEFQIAELPAGSYTIHASSVDPETNDCVATVKRLNLTKDVSGLQLVLAPCATITVELHLEHTKQGTNKNSYVLDENGAVRPNLRYLSQAILRPKDDRGFSPTYRAGAEKDDAGKAILRGVEPGRYSVELPLMRGVYVESMQSGMTDLLRDDLVVAPGAVVAPIEARVRDDAAMLDGKVKLDPGMSAAAVIAIPEQASRGAKTALAFSGQFQFSPLAPGRYELLAVDRLDDFAYAERDVMDKFLARAKEVTLRPNDRTTVDLELVHVGREAQQ